MSRLLEDMLSEEEYKAIEAVFASRAVRFDKLALLAGLDPKEDFKHSDLSGVNFSGADLRGFDLTGCDLRKAIRNQQTKIDQTTTLLDAKIDWLDEADLPIVTLMQDVERASTSEARQRALEELGLRFGKTNHVLAFVVNAAIASSSIEAFIDYIDFLPPNPLQNDVDKLSKAADRLLAKKFATNRSRTRRDGTAVFASSSIMDRLAKAEGSLAERWYRSIAKLVTEVQSSNMPQGFTIAVEKQVILKALEALKHDGNSPT